MTNMQKQVEYITLNEIEKSEYQRIAFTQEEIDNALSFAVREDNEHYVGTDVKQWLKRFTILDKDDMIETFSSYDDEGDIKESSWLERKFELIGSDNTYNWSGSSNVDVQFMLLQDIETQSCYAHVMIQMGASPLGAYTKGIIVDLDTYSNDCFINFVDCLNEVGNDGYIEIDGIGYSVQGDITSEYLSIYNYKTHESYEITGCVYEFDERGFENALYEIVIEALEENKKD